MPRYWIYLFWKDELLTKYKSKTSEHILQEMYERKINKLGIYNSSHQLILASISSLIKLQQYREDELCIILKQK